jgi:hypothetical protein
VGLTKLLVEAKLCGLLPVGLTKLLVEAKLCGLLLVGLTKLLVEALSCGLGCLWFYAFEKYLKNYMAHMVYYVVSVFIS